MFRFNNLKSSLFSINFKMHHYGWAALHLNCDGINVLIDLSDVFDPFQDLVNWGWNIQQNILPASININEEGHIATIIASNSKTENTLSIQLKSRSFKYIFKIDRLGFCHIFKQEVKRFFKDEFNTNEWEEMNEEGNLPFYNIKDWVLNHIWINQNE